MSVADTLRTARRALAWNTLDRRRALGRTIEDVALDVNLAPRLWSSVEAGKGNPTLATIARVAAALGADVRDLFAPVGR